MQGVSCQSGQGKSRDRETGQRGIGGQQRWQRRADETSWRSYALGNNDWAGWMTENRTQMRGAEQRVGKKASQGEVERGTGQRSARLGRKGTFFYSIVIFFATF